jgi:hypothetical protein
MNCVRCGRELKEPAKTIQTRNGPIAWGPICAVRDGLIQPKTRQVVIEPEEQEYDPNQMELAL